MRNGLNDVRGQRRAEKKFYDQDSLQQCIVCGRLFCRRKDKVCSMTCLKKQEEKHD